MGKWQNLTAQQKAQVIKFAIQNGVYDIKTIRDTYNLYSNGGDLVHKKSGEEQGESSYIQKQDNTNIYSLPIIDPVPVPDEMRLSDEKLVALNHAKALYANEGLEIVSPEFDLLTLARGFMTEPLGIIKGKNAAKKPLAIGAEDFIYGTKDNINKYFDNAVKSEATWLLENPRYRGLLEWPYEDIAIYRKLPDEVLDIYSEGVIPRMVEQRPWLNADDFIRDIENALLYRSPGYAVYPDKVFVKAGLDDVAGMYFPSTGQISIAEGYVQKALPHEIRHKLDDAIDLTLSENNYLQNAYGNIFSDIKGFKTSDMAKEMVTTNLDSRLKLLGRHSTSDIKIQNALIDRASDDLIFKAVEQSNSYGKKFIELLKEQGLLTPERAQYFRDAMKYVGMFSAPMVLATTTDNQKSTGGPLYPFSFEKNPFMKTPVVRYDEGGEITNINLPEFTVMPRDSFVTYTGEETVTPTQEQFIKSKQDEARVLAGHKILKQPVPLVPKIPNQNKLSKALGYLGVSDNTRIKLFGDEDGASCIYTATGMYPKENQVSGTLTFAKDPDKYGFIPVQNGKFGDIGLFERHGTVVTGFNENREPVLSYSRGIAAPDPTAMAYDQDNWKPYGPHSLYNLGPLTYYRFIGTPEQQREWTNLYNTLYSK